MKNQFTVTIKDFDLAQTADSGQCFRMEPAGGGGYLNIASDRYVEIVPLADDEFAFSCSPEEFKGFWRHYFDLDTDYSAFKKTIVNDPFLAQAVVEGGGIRILRQDLWEMAVTFIISANNNIPRIKGAVNRICQRWGEKKTAVLHDGSEREYYAFPKAEALAGAALSELRDCGLGYRDAYVLQLARETAACQGANLERLKRAAGYEEAMKELTAIKGVGIKVANCIALFGLHIMDAYPEDTWMKAMIKDIYGGSFDAAPYSGFAGYIQQLQFYCYRKQTKEKRR